MNKIHGQDYYYIPDPNYIDRWKIVHKKSPFEELSRMLREHAESIVRVFSGLAEAASGSITVFKDLEKAFNEMEEIEWFHRIRKEYQGCWLL